jgi:ABC-type transport system involved in multi-copper enzyme maturation permease subunit
VNDFLRGAGTVLAIELRQRVRGVAWYVLLGVFFVLVLIVTALVSWILRPWNGGEVDDTVGAGIYSTVVYFVLLLATLVAPAVSGNAINGDREAGTLATTQVTLVSTPQLVAGKFLAAWISSLAFLAAATPFIVYSFSQGGFEPATVVVSLLVLAAELAVVSALGVGLSGLIRRPLFSIVLTYLAVATLSIGTLIAFTLGGLALQERYTVRYESFDYSSGEVDPVTGMPENPVCVPSGSWESAAPRFDRVWWILAANPYVILADAVPTRYDGEFTTDLFGTIKLGVRAAQRAPEMDRTISDCDNLTADPGPTPRDIIESGTPGWAVGLLLHAGLAGAALVGAGVRTHAPSRRLAAGSRVA